MLSFSGGLLYKFVNNDRALEEQTSFNFQTE